MGKGVDMKRERANGFLTNLGSFLRGEFVRNEDGLVTVEWVALAAAVVVGGIALVWVVMDNLKTPAGTIGNNINPLATVDPNP
jgi:hypothetical protein